MAIRILTTGGTIDGLEYAAADKAPKLSRSLIHQLVKQARLTLRPQIESVLAKDSKTGFTSQ